MAEKLTRARCSVEGHGTKCCVAREVEREQKERAKRLRREQDKRECNADED